MINLRKNGALTMAFLIAVQPMLVTIPAFAQEAPTNDKSFYEPHKAFAPEQLSIEALEARGVDLSGTYEPKAVEKTSTKDRLLGEDGSPLPVSPLANLPVLDQKLEQKVAASRADESLRIILHLEYQPHAAVFREVENSMRGEIDQLESDRTAFLKALGSQRNLDANIDSENYSSIKAPTEEERAMQKSIGERNEALSYRMKQEVTAQLRQMIDMDQQPILDELKAIGADVEFTTIAGNLIVATLPAGKVSDVAKIDGIMRMVEDSVMEGHLSNAARATMVDPSDVSLSGLWDAGLTGGIYDPGIIDSGIDLAHPAMTDSVAPLRVNFGSWYLVAANGSAAFDDAFTQDDLQGHGTHVAGIVASYGSPGGAASLGMSHGVEKVVNLKAGWLNTSGTSSMFWSDKYLLVDRALNNGDALVGDGNFADDVDGFNLSYGGATTLDDTDGSRFWDSVISTYSDTPVTISAGNSGPNNTLFSDPAISYNAITVANYNDRGTVSLDDDIINAGSTVGPTANGRKKPDLAAPGTNISAPNHNWEVLFAPDFVNKTGTSMAAPMVLGVIMDLMDAGVFDELALKALLINTAQKNRPGMNIESDADGWDPQIGWGVMNAYSAYFHRFDTFQESLDPRDTENNWESGDYQLYAGTMEDEGASGEGRDRATMVWNRQATYLAGDTPDEFFTLTDMNLRLFNENNNISIDSELGVADNVHQVRINAGAPETPVVVKAYSWSTAYSHGGTTEQVAVATEEGFVRVDFPTDFQGIAVWPVSVEPSEVFDVTFWLRNDSDIASHNNVFDLNLPAGWTLISGTDTQNVGTALAGGITSMVSYTLRAPPAPAVGAQTFTVAHSHSSYLENYGNFNWNLTVTVEVDTTPPNPDPMTFSVLPDQVSTVAMDMVASNASDLHNEITYYHDYTSSPSGGGGGTDSGWQASRNYVDNGLFPNDEYCYRVWARDSANFPNLTTPSGVECAYTSQITPGAPSLGAVTTTSIQVTPAGPLQNLGLGSSGLRLRNSTNSSQSAWQQSTNAWNSVGLTPATKYNFVAQARNGDADETANSSAVTGFTLANPPAIGSVTAGSSTAVNIVINPNGNSNQAEYYIENTTAGTNSGWISSTNWQSAGLQCETLYAFQARARNGAGVESIIVPFGVQTTGDCTLDSDNDGVEDSADNCTLISNPDQRDTNGDGYGNACDPDLDNNGTVNFVDISIFSGQFPSAGADLDADFNGDDLVNFVDYILFTTFFLDPPGPSGVAP
ncbi:MAG: S8 family serine peptidase [Gammaproteobacteria bacterium]